MYALYDKKTKEWFYGNKQWGDDPDKARLYRLEQHAKASRTNLLYTESYYHAYRTIKRSDFTNNNTGHIDRLRYWAALDKARDERSAYCKKNYVIKEAHVVLTGE